MEYHTTPEVKCYSYVSGIPVILRGGGGLMLCDLTIQRQIYQTSALINSIAGGMMCGGASKVSFPGSEHLAVYPYKP